MAETEEGQQGPANLAATLGSTAPSGSTILPIGQDADEYNRAPDGALRWPAPDRDSARIGTFAGSYTPAPALAALLRMDGKQGRSEIDVTTETGAEVKRPRRWHKLFERMGIFYPGDGVTRLGRLGRLLRDASKPDGMKQVIAREALEVLRRYQFNNPVERALPKDCTVHPYWCVMKAASELDWKIHWDEVNRELMRLVKDDELATVIKHIKVARADPGYADFIGSASNDKGLLLARTHPADAVAPEGKTPEGQLRDQRMTPFLKRVGFGELLLESPGPGGEGYWTIPPDVRDAVTAAVVSPPPEKVFATIQEWIDWFCEGVATASGALPPPPKLAVQTPVADLDLAKIKAALQLYDPDLSFSDDLLISLVSALRAGNGKNFIILKGISGTGKSRLVDVVAKAVYGRPKVDQPNLTYIGVRPDWVDGSSLIGHYDPVGGRYVRVPFLDAMLEANRSDAPIFVCLDEMNLARVEYYLADCLSAMESGKDIPLDIRSDPQLASSIAWPPNLYLFGTVNIDESTLSISDKVLDRAQVIDTSDFLLGERLEVWSNTKRLSAEEKKRVCAVIVGAWEALRPVNAHFGFRSAQAMMRFIDEAFAVSDSPSRVDDALDAQLCQKVLVKLRGEGERWNSPLVKLDELCKELGSKRRAYGVISRMREDLGRYGSFQFWN